MLALTRNLVPCWDVIRRDHKWTLPVPLEQMRVLRELTVGLVAYGKIAREVARRLRPFKCRILVADPFVDKVVIEQDGFTPVTLEELYEQADIISLHCPSTEKTRFMINRRTLDQMKEGVIIVNAGRGDLIKTEDLIAALQSSKVAGAGLDVTWPEPIDMNSPLLEMPNVIINAHIASASAGAVRTLRTTAANIVEARLKGKKLPNIVNGVEA